MTHLWGIKCGVSVLRCIFVRHPYYFIHCTPYNITPSDSKSTHKPAPMVGVIEIYPNHFSDYLKLSPPLV